MPRGSRPGERRGGRHRGTPNRRSVLADRILLVAGEHHAASWQSLLGRLALDRELPPDVRIAIAERPSTRRGGGEHRRTVRESEKRTEAWLAIVQDVAAEPKGRRKAALKLAAQLLPMKPANKRWRFEIDECGFAINAQIAKEYRELDFKLSELRARPDRALPRIAKIIRSAAAKHAEIVARLECPGPESYSTKQIWNDRIQLGVYAGKRHDGYVLSEAEDADDAHRRARYHCYAEGAEQTARNHRIELEDAEIIFKRRRFFKEAIAGPPFTRKKRDDLRLLRILYPPPSITREAEPDEEWLWPIHRHPFRNAEPAADGNFYPHDSKLRPPQPEIVEEFVDVPPHSYFKRGVGVVFGYDPNVDPETDTTFRPLDLPEQP